MDKKTPRTVGILTLVWILCVLPAITAGASGPELYEAEVRVSGQQPGERAAAMKSALSEVLVRITGRREQAHRELLQDPARYVQQYRYYTVPDSQPPQLRLQVRFNGGALQQALRQQGVAYWGDSERPDTLVWLAIEERGMRSIVAADDDSVARRQLQLAARQRGVPLLFPLLDLEDQAQVRFGDIWGGFFDRVLAASERYRPQAVLIGRLNRNPYGEWVARWSLQAAGNTTSWSDSDPRLETLLPAGIDNMADTLAMRLAVTDTGAPGDAVAIRVEDINTLAAYARVNDYLASLSAIRKFQVEQVSGSAVQYALQLNGSLQGLTRTISIGTVLESSPSGAPGSYRLRQ
jgi:hypothetical protein